MTFRLPYVTPAKKPQRWATPDATQAVNVQLFTNPIPFAQYDWPKVQSVKYVSSDATDPSEMWLFPVATVSPFYTQDFSTSKRLPNIPVAVSPNLVLNQFSTPFVNNPVNNTKDLVGLLDQTQQTNINLFTNPIPFAQLDYSKTGNIPDWAPPTAYPNLVINTTVVPNPFIPVDYNRVFTPVIAKPDQQALNINIYTNPIPFGPYAWNSMRAAKASIDPQLPNLVILQPIGAPFSQLDWSKAYRVNPKSSNQNDLPNLLLIQPASPSNPLGIYGWLDWSRSKSPVIIVPDQNNLPNIVLPNTPIPVPDILQAGGKTKWPKWGRETVQSNDANIKAAAAVLSSLGGQARAKALTANQRSNIASIAAKARWK